MPRGHRSEFWRVDTSTVATPQQDGDTWSKRSNEPTHEQHHNLDRNSLKTRHRVLKLNLQRATLSIARNNTNRDERQQESCRQLTRTKGWRPNADQRRECLAHAG